MQESYGDGLATHTDPESCVVTREGGREALTGGSAGRALSRERRTLRDADAVGRGGRLCPAGRVRETGRGPARSEHLGMHGHTSRENRESRGLPVADGATGRVGKSKDARRR